LFSFKKWHNLTKANLIISPSLILFFLPLIYGHVQKVDFIDAPLILLGLSIIPQLILIPKFPNILYIISFLYFLLLISCVDHILVHFAQQDFDLIRATPNFHFFYKLILITVYIFIQSSIYYLKHINYRYENELISTNKKLTSTVETLKTTQEHLIESEKKASLSILTAGIAHEINNPLNFIHGGTLFLEHYIKDNFPTHIKDVQPMIDGINTGVKRTSDIVKKLNQYNACNTLTISDCDLHHVIDKCLNLLNHKSKNRVEIIKHYTKTPYTYKGQDGKLQQAFINIISNALHAIANEDQGKITIQTNIINEACHITISDNGHGIAPENMKNILDPFFTTKPPGEGTGLGLSITQKIIREHQGTIAFESLLKSGTKVKVILPLKIK